jgi:hypothetical protein
MLSGVVPYNSEAEARFNPPPPKCYDGVELCGTVAALTGPSFR